MAIVLELRDQDGNQWIHPEFIAQYSGMSAKTVRRCFDRFCGGTPPLMERARLKIALPQPDGRVKVQHQVMYRRVVEDVGGWVDLVTAWKP